MTSPIPSYLDVGLGTAILTLGTIPAARWTTRMGRDASGFGIFLAFLALAPVMNRAALVPTSLWLAGALFCTATLAARTRHPHYMRVLVTLGAALAAACSGFGSALGSGAAGIGMTTLVLFACTSALRNLDIVEGLAAGIVAIAAAVLAIAFHALHLFAWRDLGAAVCGALLAFLFLHAVTRGSRAVLGDGAVLGCGFLLGVLALRLVQVSPSGRAIFAPWLILSVPLLELGLAATRQILERGGPGERPQLRGGLLATGLGRSRVLGLFWGTSIVAGILALRFLEV